ncbi:MAG TPA: IclR family transcriptional regulator [Aestuariivirga sp.]|nr:IclR family transcriptional regulator [Aestuariivirga sp.]
MSPPTRVHEKLAGGKAGVYSVEVAAEILLQLANFRQPTSLKSLSERCKLSPSKVHRYLSSLTKLGLAFQGQKSGNYSLGKNAILLGLAAMQHIDQIDDVMEGLPQLVKELECHVYLTVWSKMGPTLIKVERSNDSLAIPLMLGQTLPVLHSSSGRMFLAFLDAAQTRELIANEKASYNDSNLQSEDELRAVLKEIRQNRFAVSTGEVESETTAISAPVLDWQDNPIVVVTGLVSKHSDKDKIQSVLTGVSRFTEQKSVHRPTFPFES